MDGILKFHFPHYFIGPIVFLPAENKFSKDNKERKMIVSAPADYREAARHRLPRFLFDYIDGGADRKSVV